MNFICEAVEPARSCAGICGKSFIPLLRAGTRRQYCSEECRPNLGRIARTYLCKRCSLQFTSRQADPKFCSKRCCSSSLADTLRARASIKGPPEHRKRVCQRCSISFVMRNPSGKARAGLSSEGKYCSRSCASSAIRKYASKSDGQRARMAARAMVRPIPNNASCKCCGADFRPATSRQVYCSKRCRVSAAWPSKLSAQPARCMKCSGIFVPVEENRRKFCSEECGRVYHKDRAGTNHRKRARYHGVVYEYINISKVLERDNYRCQVCGKATPKRLRGSTDDSAPELDHRIPMAMGGGHLWANVQCACRRCNAEKGGTVIAGQTNFFYLIEVPRRHRRNRADLGSITL